MNLKSAVQQYQETSKNLVKISDSTEKISETNMNLVDNTKQFLEKFENMKLDTTEYSQVSSPLITVDGTTNLNVTVSGSGLNSSVVSWVITDENDYILIGVNQDGELLDTITFDFVNKRSGVNYKY